MRFLGSFKADDIFERYMPDKIPDFYRIDLGNIRLRLLLQAQIDGLQAFPTELFLAFNGLDDFIPPYEAITSHAVDPYVALRNAYLETLYLSKPIVSKPKK